MKVTRHGSPARRASDCSISATWRCPVGLYGCTPPSTAHVSGLATARARRPRRPTCRRSREVRRATRPRPAARGRGSPRSRSSRDSRTRASASTSARNELGQPVRPVGRPGGSPIRGRRPACRRARAHCRTWRSRRAAGTGRRRRSARAPRRRARRSPRSGPGAARARAAGDRRSAARARVPRSRRPLRSRAQRARSRAVPRRLCRRGSHGCMIIQVDASSCSAEERAGRARDRAARCRRSGCAATPRA